MMIPLSLALSLGLSACESADSSEANTITAEELVPTAHGTITVRGSQNAEIVAGEGSLEVRVDGSAHALIVTPVADELSLSWDGQIVDPEAELPLPIAEAFGLVQRVLADEGLVSHLFAGKPALAGLFLSPHFKSCQITGCSGQVCASEPVFTTCEWRPEYECLSLTKCGPFGKGWSCGWLQTPAYLECLESYAGGLDDGGLDDGGLDDAGSDAGSDDGADECDGGADEGGGELCGCETDNDCVKTVGGCCPCSAGGQEIAVAQACIDDVPGCDLEPGSYACLQVYMCTDSVAVCTAGQCELTKGGVLF